MTLDEYQNLAMRTANAECVDLSNAALGLCGEAGEFADIVKKHLHQGHALDRPKLIREVGDVLWYVALACEVLGVTIDEVAQTNVDKLRKRFPDGFSYDASVNRGDK